MRAAILLVFALALLDAPARAQQLEASPDPSSYEETLAPYGTFADAPDYGEVWRPAVGADWQPYVDGQWMWSPYGWTWVSYEPWAWTFHYGRWVVVPGWGWVWVPGAAWGPAWVDWFSGDGFVGWAPLSPFGHQDTIDRFVFVREDEFCSAHLRGFVVDHHLVPDDVLRRFGRHEWQPPLRDHIEQVAHHPIGRIDGRPPTSLAPHPVRSVVHLAPPPAEPRMSGARLRGAAEMSTAGGVVREPSTTWRGANEPVFVTPRPHGAVLPGSSVLAGSRQARPGMHGTGGGMHGAGGAHGSGSGASAGVGGGAAR